MHIVVFVAMTAGTLNAFDQDKELWDLRLKRSAKEYFAQKNSEYGREGSRCIAKGLGGLYLTEKINYWFLTEKIGNQRRYTFYPDTPLCNPVAYLFRAGFAFTAFHGFGMLYKYYNSNPRSTDNYHPTKK